MQAPQQAQNKSTPPKAIAAVQNYVSPLNAVYALPVTVAGIFDFLSPYGAFLLLAAIGSGLVLAIDLLKNKAGGRLLSKKKHTFVLVSFLIFSATATANLAIDRKNGVLASASHRIKTWQDQYLTDIKQDTEAIKKQTADNGAKLDKTNMMLAQILDGIRPELEKPLVEQISGYKTLPEHQQNALLLLTSKVGVNGIKRYKRLVQAVNTYSEQRTPENARVVTQYLTYIVRVNGKDVEDTKTEKLLASLFLDPQTYAYLVGIGALPQDQSLLTTWNIDLSKPAGEQLDDPLGDLIKSLTAAGTPIEKQVVIPANENPAARAEENTQTSPSLQEKKHKRRDKNNHGRATSVYLS